MGRDLEQYVHPERVSSQLICPICTQVLKNPVQTATEHLFCEDELLEWMTRSNLCPITKTVLNPSEIRKPSRIILNMLSELQIFCNYRGKGCAWVGNEEQLTSHMEKECIFHHNAILQETVEFQGVKLQENMELLAQLELKNHQLQQENQMLTSLVEDYKQRLRLFHALIPEPNASSRSARHNVIAASDDEGGLDDSYYEDTDSSRDYQLSRGFYQRSSHYSQPVEHKRDSPPHFPSIEHNSPGRSLRNTSGGTSNSRKVTDAERLQRLQGLRSFNASLEERKDFESKDNRK
mmetsp:Transcript_12837/g.13867  ORF Transcript_12837/g.13867 Transcript_12837/m.13867 type:complete len:292 (+) Transcript_12837:491-1366(+)